MSSIEAYFNKYGESHQNATNKLIHWICVPLIFFTLMGLLYLIPFPAVKTWYANWAAILLLGGLLFYAKHSWTIFIGFLVISYLVIKLVVLFEANLGSPNTLYVFISIFVIAWIGQFIGHKIEGKKPSFLDDAKYLLIGPAWLLHFIYKKIGIPY